MKNKYKVVMALMRYAGDVDCSKLWEKTLYTYAVSEKQAIVRARHRLISGKPYYVGDFVEYELKCIGCEVVG